MTNPSPNIKDMEKLILQLLTSNTKETAIAELSKKREVFPDFAPCLWHTPGCIAALLQEVISIYPLLSPPTLTSAAANRACNALALLQIVASHAETKPLFLQASIPMFVYPFLTTLSKTRPFEYLRLTSLGVIGALVKVDDSDVVSFLLNTEIIPLCLRTMEIGTELSKTVATFIVQKTLLDEDGLKYMCETPERFFTVNTVLSKIVSSPSKDEQPSSRLLKHVIRCYLRLSDNPHARDALKNCLPELLRSQEFAASIRLDESTLRWLAQLLTNVGFHEAAAQMAPEAVEACAQKQAARDKQNAEM